MAAEDDDYKGLPRIFRNIPSLVHFPRKQPSGLLLIRFKPMPSETAFNMVSGIRFPITQPSYVHTVAKMLSCPCLQVQRRIRMSRSRHPVRRMGRRRRPPTRTGKQCERRERLMIVSWNTCWRCANKQLYVFCVRQSS